MCSAYPIQHVLKGGTPWRPLEAATNGSFAVAHTMVAAVSTEVFVLVLASAFPRVPAAFASMLLSAAWRWRRNTVEMSAGLDCKAEIESLGSVTIGRGDEVVVASLVFCSLNILVDFSEHCERCPVLGVNVVVV